MHVPKAGGTSVAASLRLRFDSARVMPQLQMHYHGMHIIWYAMARHYDLFGVDMHLDHPSLDAIAKGLARLNRQPVMLTVLRNPVERLYSRYKEWRGTPDSQFIHAKALVQKAIRIAKNETFESFLMSDNKVIVDALNNLQARLLAGLVESRSLSESNIMERASRNIRTYDIVGTTDELDQVMLLVDDALGLPVNQSSEKIPKLHRSAVIETGEFMLRSKEAKARLESYTVLDNALWEYAHHNHVCDHAFRIAPESTIFLRLNSLKLAMEADNSESSLKYQMDSVSEALREFAYINCIKQTVTPTDCGNCVGTNNHRAFSRSC